jgi:hypothetical protein
MMKNAAEQFPYNTPVKEAFYYRMIFERPSNTPIRRPQFSRHRQEAAPISVAGEQKLWSSTAVC